MKSRKLSRKRQRATIVGAAAASVVAGAALLPNWSAGAANVAADPKVDASTKATFQRLADAVFTDRTDALLNLTDAAPRPRSGRGSGLGERDGGVERTTTTRNVRIVRPDVNVTGGRKVHYVFDSQGNFTGTF
ncbi:hypothetical protein [Streptomyces sp. NPDC060027]|uniref:hypothetical protein n=1 Tax=Streptomyces sp. NPDC060027 TaxID=3347040 RepID=UPI00367C73D1